MAKRPMIIPVREYGRPDLQSAMPQNVDAGPPDLSLANAELIRQNKQLRDKISRMERMIEDELRMWKRGLETGEWENREALKRRMSRMRGAVEYRGNENNLSTSDAAINPWLKEK